MPAVAALPQQLGRRTLSCRLKERPRIFQPQTNTETPSSAPTAGPPAGNQADASPSQPANPEASEESPYLPNPFNLPIPRNRGPYDYSHKIHCDVLRHLKVPATWRRLDTYMRPTYMLPKPKSDALADMGWNSFKS